MSSICDFRKITFRDLTAYFSFLIQEILWFSDNLIKGLLKLILCRNIINFDSVDFSERRPEEVISFF